MSAGMHIIFVGRCPSGPPSTEYTLPTGRGLTRGDGRTTGRLLEVRRCALGSGVSLPAVWRSMLGRVRLLGLAQSSSLWTLADRRDGFLSTLRLPSSFLPTQRPTHPTMIFRLILPCQVFPMPVPLLTNWSRRRGQWIQSATQPIRTLRSDSAVVRWVCFLRTSSR